MFLNQPSEGKGQGAQKAPTTFVSASRPPLRQPCFSFTPLNQACFHNGEDGSATAGSLPPSLHRNITHRTTATATAINAILTQTNIGLSLSPMKPREREGERKRGEGRRTMHEALARSAKNKHIRTQSMPPMTRRGDSCAHKIRLTQPLSFF